MVPCMDHFGNRFWGHIVNKFGAKFWFQIGYFWDQFEFFGATLKMLVTTKILYHLT